MISTYCFYICIEFINDMNETSITRLTEFAASVWNSKIAIQITIERACRLDCVSSYRGQMSNVKTNSRNVKPTLWTRR